MAGPPLPPSRKRGGRRRKKKSSKGLVVLALVTFLINILFCWTAWSLIQSRDQEGPAAISLFYALPEPTSIVEPSPTPTKVVLALPTPDRPQPTRLSLADVTSGLIRPTATPTPIPAARPASAPAPEPTATPQPGIDHVIIISIDGLRPDALFVAEAPTLDRFIARGAYCPTAQTVLNSTTLPSHASMLTGMIPEKHGLLWNGPYIGWPGLNGPTLFTVAHEAGLSTAMVFGKQKMNYMIVRDEVGQLLGGDTHDPEVKNWAIEVIQKGLPNLLFIHFPDVDRVGHSYGWMSENQLQSIHYVDGLISEIEAALASGGYLERTLLIISADHGGHSFTHGDDSPEDRTIPWLAVGPGVPAGLTLTRNVNTYDTAATALYALNLPIPGTWDGKPVLEIFPAGQPVASLRD